VLQFCQSFWAWHGVAQKTMGRRLVRHVCPRWAAGLFNLQNAPRRKPSGAALRGVLQEALFFIGGFDQNAGFERGTPAEAGRLVIECFEATRDHAGYIVCPSDHFFHGDPACLRAFAAAARECRY